MKLLSFAAADRVEKEISQLAATAVQRCHAEAVSVIGTKIQSFSFSAARGFIRAKIGGHLRKEIASLSQLPANVADEIEDAALERALESLTQLVLGEMLKNQRLLRTEKKAA